MNPQRVCGVRCWNDPQSERIRSSCGWHRATITWLALTLLVFSGTVLAEAPANSDDHCPLCANETTVPIVQLSTAWLDSLAHARADFNDQQISRIDSLLVSGHFGSPKTYSTQKRAHLLTRLTTINAYHDLFQLATDSTVVYEANESILGDLYKHYSDVYLFSAIRLKSIRLGLGRVCMLYDVDKYATGKEQYGERTLRWRIQDTEIDGEEHRLLHVDLPNGPDVIKVMLAAHHSFEVEYHRIEGPPAPYEWFLVHNLQGVWLRKHGTHRPTAYMFWVSPMDSQPQSFTNLPITPLIGVRIYIPGLRFRLPLLPDVDLDDLREVELLMPILSMEYIEDRRRPDWLGKTKLGFKNWKGFGSVPPEIRQRFPDL